MTGPVESAALVFVGALMLGALGLAWRARGILSDLQVLIAVKVAELEKDVRHTKVSVAQHAVQFAEMLQDQTRLQSEVARLGNLVNGKH